MQRIWKCYNLLFFQALIDDIILQINPADELSKLVYKICQMQDSNQNDELNKGLLNLSSRWNSLNLKVINNSNRSVFICFFKFISNMSHHISNTVPIKELTTGRRIFSTKYRVLGCLILWANISFLEFRYNHSNSII